jgi:hypothetical protein
MSAEVLDDMPSPWWPCPECGGAEFRTTVMFERGEWISDDEYELSDPPTGRPAAVAVQNVECVGCGNRFDIHGYYGWPGWPEESE